MSGVSNSWRMGETRRLTTPSTHRDKHHRFPAELINPAVWRYCRCCRSSRDLAALLCARGGRVTYEAIRQGWFKFGQPSATQRRRRRPQSGDKWPLDDVFRTLNGQRHDLGRAGEQDGKVLEMLGQRRRDQTAAKPCFRKLLNGCRYGPRVLVTERLKRSGAAKRERLPGVEPRPPR
jgi:putative transposase